MKPVDTEFVMRVLRAVPMDCCDRVWWRTDDDTATGGRDWSPVTFIVNCGDGDCETVTPDNVAELEKAFADCRAADPVYGVIWAGDLFAARVRKRCPHPADLKGVSPELAPLFWAAGG